MAIRKTYDINVNNFAERRDVERPGLAGRERLKPLAPLALENSSPIHSRTIECRRKSKNHDDAMGSLAPSSTRNFCDHTTTGRHKSWSSTTIISTIANTAQIIAGTSPRATATLMYEPMPGSRKSFVPNTNDS